MLNNKTEKQDFEKVYDQMQKKEKLFTSVINTIFVIVIVAVLMMILSILNVV